MNYLSLFSGIGGLDLGLDRAGMTCVGQVELDPFCRRVLAKHWPEVPRHDDVRTAVQWWLGKPRPVVDAIVGGFPCQPVSVAGLRLAQDDARWLWPATHVVIRDLRPRYAILENVPGLLGRGMGDVLGDLAEIGYDAEWDCVPAASVGAPHRRDRVFLVAYPDCRPDGDEQPRRDGAVGHGPQRAVANANGASRRPAGNAVGNHGTAALLPGAPSESGGRRGSVADSHGPRRGPWEGLGRPSWPAPVRGGRWTAEPDMGRVAHGVPGRLDRLRALGNAVVPQVAEHIGRLVIAAARATEEVGG